MAKWQNAAGVLDQNGSYLLLAAAAAAAAAGAAAARRPGINESQSKWVFVTEGTRPPRDSNMHKL